MQMYQLCPNCTLQRLKHSTGRLQVELMLVRLVPCFTRWCRAASALWLPPYRWSWILNSITLHPPTHLCCRGTHQSSSCQCRSQWRAQSGVVPKCSQPQESWPGQRAAWSGWAGTGGPCSGCLRGENGVSLQHLPPFRPILHFYFHPFLLYGVGAALGSLSLLPAFSPPMISNIQVGSPAGCTPLLGDRRKEKPKQGWISLEADGKLRFPASDLSSN